MNIIGNRKLPGTIKGNIPELTVLPQIHCTIVSCMLLFCSNKKKKAKKDKKTIKSNIIRNKSLF